MIGGGVKMVGGVSLRIGDCEVSRCGFFTVNAEWVCPRGLDKRECALCDGYEACMESAWALFEELIKKKKLDK